MRNLFIVCAFMFSALCVGQMSFSISNNFDLRTPMSEGEENAEGVFMPKTEANIGWFMNDDILVSFGMADWDNFNVSARYYTGFCDNMFIQATTFAVGTMESVLNEDTQLMEDVPDGDSEYSIGAAIGWTKSLGIWKLQFEPMVKIENIQDFTPTLAWALRFNL